MTAKYLQKRPLLQVGKANSPKLGVMPQLECWPPASLVARKASRPEGRAYGSERIMEWWV